MEGLAGVAGYATQMISGIPTGTAINFTTNAGEIVGQIVTLIAARDALYAESDNLSGRTNGISTRINQLKAQLSSALTSSVSTLALPTSGGGSGGGSSAADRVADEVARAAQDAARKLEQDQTAQLRFGDAFGTIMEAALGGNFEQYRDRLEDQITSLTRDGYQAAADTLKRLSGTLTQASLDYAALTNKLSGLLDAANAMGDTVANAMYKQGADAIQSYVEGLKSGQLALSNQLELMGNNVLNQTAGAITPGNAGYAAINAQPRTVVYQFGDIQFSAEKLRDLESIEDFLNLLRQAPTTQLVNAAGTVTS